MHIRACKLTIRTAALTIALLGAACQKQETSTAFIARVGDEVLTEEAFRAEAIRRGVSTEGGKAELLEQMLRDMKLLQHARAKGYDKDPEIVRQTRALLIARARDDFGQGAEAKDPAPDERALQAYYDTHGQEFAVGTRVHAAMIFVATPKGLNAAALAEKQRKAAAARAAIEAAGAPANTHFGAIAAQFSEDQVTRYSGGDLGYQVEGLVNFTEDPVAIAALFALRSPGQLSEVVTSPSGLYVFKLIERDAPMVQPLAAVRDRIRAKLGNVRRAEKERAFTEALAAVPAQTRPEALSGISLPQRQLSDAHQKPPALPGE
jgi:parvulin-like peptidyl-prolyl isomerase